ncbi:hypothetical protein PoB_006267100 [Plakobranchus ocellatus]|uniref:Uncharacterized protein n=1 Tax=Plakobranchus ocellatus TaxID=259542 RepID=A0AAV4CWT7_9GAST|nr:hypothetical protein PoB_006267100 [Plakobranchus ocellatus]
MLLQSSLPSPNPQHKHQANSHQHLEYTILLPHIIVTNISNTIVFTVSRPTITIIVTVSRPTNIIIVTVSRPTKTIMKPIITNILNTSSYSCLSFLQTSPTQSSLPSPNPPR